MFKNKYLKNYSYKNLVKINLVQSIIMVLLIILCINLGNKVQELKPETKKPPMFDVILLNDDFTPMDFVVYVLKEIFNHTDQQANEIMLKVHNEGEASCGIFTKDLAETKSYEVNNLAKINDHPLISIVKPIYD